MKEKLTRIVTTGVCFVLMSGGVALGANDPIQQPGTIDTADMAAARGLLEAREFGAALEQAESVLERYASPYERYAAELVDPLLVAGDAHLALEQPLAAYRQFQRAQSIQRQSYGLNSPEQLTTLYRQADALVALGDYHGANDRHEMAYSIARDHLPSDSPTALDAALRLADWYAEHFHLYFARAMYDRAFEIAVSVEVPLEQRVRILRQIAWTYRMELYPTKGPGRFRPTTSCCGGYTAALRFGRLSAPNRKSAERALATAANLLGREPAANRTLLADVLLDLGDWYILRDRRERASETYHLVWELVDTERREVLFSRPMMLYRPHPGSPQKPREPYDPTPKFGFIEIAVRVNDEGRVRSGPKVQESRPENLLPIKYLRQARFARFRPAFVDGELRDDGEASLLYGFRYYER